jgi:DNA-binding transcriptional LysR family regulator
MRRLVAGGNDALGRLLLSGETQMTAPFDGRLLAGVSVLSVVIESGNFARAAGVLALSASGVSRAIARLESRVGIRLLERTTRSMTLTEEGRRFFEEVSPHLQAIEDAAGNAAGAVGTVRGRLRVDVDPFLAQVFLAHRLGDLLNRYPELSLDLTTREHIGDLIADGIDVGLRFGEPSGSSAIARKLLETKILTVAAPSLLKRLGRPKHPKDLVTYPCLHFRDPVSGRPFDWEFHRRREIVKVATKSRLLLSDVGTTLTATLTGAGIAQVMALSIRDEIRRGKLVDLFPDWPDERFPLYALYPSRLQPSAKVRAFVDFALEAVK